MERIYTNRRQGERRIHVEIDENEIADLLDELAPIKPEAFQAMQQLVQILQTAHATFVNAHEAEASRT
ncbi:hypothetical protein ACFW81_24135 [Streptomyces angustmyceticus]|uniref:hypothetical protein n=1 Tax=Streptomyces angustmyceticus TaxID=285578 RepID=UPI0036BB1A0F